MDASIKPLSDKVSMFATNDELYEQLTAKEISLIKESNPGKNRSSIS